MTIQFKRGDKVRISGRDESHEVISADNRIVWIDNKGCPDWAQTRYSTDRVSHVMRDGEWQKVK
jgi:hypothetical protein